jgi:hypothetical protein
MSEKDNDNNCKSIFVFGGIALVLVVLAFVSGANAMGIVLVAAAIAILGYGAGTIMNSAERPHG